MVHERFTEGLSMWNEIVVALDNYQYPELRNAVGTTLEDESCYQLCKFVEEIVNEHEADSEEASQEATDLECGLATAKTKHETAVALKVFLDDVEDYDEVDPDKLEELFKWAKRFAEVNYDADLNPKQ